MNGGIFLIQDDGELVEMRSQQYDSEDLLQELLCKYPNLLAGDQIDSRSPRRWLLVSREASIPGEEGGGGRWSLDHLFLDQDAIPTLIEVKRSSDTRIRREVVGQMLDYAANAVVYWPVETIIAQFENTHDDPENTINDFLGPDGDQETFWKNVKTNLKAGKVRLVFVADQIPAELKRIVEFLNEQMDPAEVLAVEIRQFVGQKLKTLVPRVIGQTEDAQKRKSGGVRATRQWDEQTFFQELRNKEGEDVCTVARNLFEWVNNNGARIWWGKGKKDGAFIPVFDKNKIDYFPIAVRTGFSYAYIQIQFEPLSSRPPFDNEERRLELLNRLNKVQGINLPLDSISRYPSFPLSILTEKDSYNTFLETLNWFLTEIT
jgi:hypothetical protein